MPAYLRVSFHFALTSGMPVQAGNTSLALAAEKGHSLVLRELLSAAANVNAENKVRFEQFCRYSSSVFGSARMAGQALRALVTTVTLIVYTNCLLHKQIRIPLPR